MIQKTLKLNFKLEEPTANDTIYLEYEFKEAMEKKLKGSGVYFYNFSGNVQTPSIQDMLGKVVNYNITKDKEIYVTIDIVAPHFNEEILDHCDITMAALAQKDEDGIATQLAVLHFYMGHKGE